ncbi:PKD domain-containing protein [Salinivirga cyanobacteriivorans]
MKNFTLLLVLLAVMISCSDEDNDGAKPTADFELTVTGESPNAELTINNLSSDATSYEWTFGAQTIIETSEEPEPENIIIDKAGKLYVTLRAKNSEGSDSKTDSIEIAGYSAIKTYTDITFGLNENSTYGRFYSFDTEQIYTANLINGENGSSIHIGFNSITTSMLQFVSPDNADDAGLAIPNATHTIVDNYQSSPVITVEEFDSMTNDSLLVDMTVTYDQDIFGSSTIPNMVFFELEDGRKGTIKAKELNSDNIVTDIKIQKY